MGELLTFVKDIVPTPTQIEIGVIGGFFGPIFAYLLGWNNDIFFLLSMMALDFVTGIMASIIDETGLSSERGYKGGMRKALALCTVMMGNWFMIYTGSAAVYLTVIYFWISNEAISILENARRAGVDVPLGLDKILIKVLEERKNR
ncbi:phage holin family protein [Veillonella ratti]|uniref:phage holin family protein n=1 Tax=Veillonella ratti TaxID=103892 RepID=UPI0013DF0A2A|nr:phage holin family protein [Veillonella ratti]